jgi:hypothetical protein
MGLRVRLQVELYTLITEVRAEASELEHNKIPVEPLETLLQWSDVQVVAEQVELRFRPIHPIRRGVDLPLMGL